MKTDQRRQQTRPLVRWLIAVAILSILVSQVIVIVHRVYASMVLDPNPSVRELGDSATRVEIAAEFWKGEGDELHRVSMSATLQTKEEIVRLISMLDAVPHRRDVIDACNCDGNPQLYFFDGDRRIGHIAIHHAKRISLHYGHWRGNYFQLVDAVRPSLDAYLAGLHIPEYEENRKSTAAAADGVPRLGR